MTENSPPRKPQDWREWLSAPAFGLWSCTDSLSTVGTLSTLGFAYITLDLQHGMLATADVRHAARFLRASPTTCVCRVPWNRPELIMQALDFGAQLIIVPMIEDSESARAAVSNTFYPREIDTPRAGTRSWGPLWPDTTEPPAEANDSVGCLVMVETARALENLDEIAATPGLAGIYVGPNDLALSLGLGRSTYLTAPIIHSALERIADACASHGIIAGLHCSSAEMAHYWADRGFSMLTSGTDTSLLATAAYELAAGVGLVTVAPGEAAY